MRTEARHRECTGCARAEEHRLLFGQMALTSKPPLVGAGNSAPAHIPPAVMSNSILNSPTHITNPDLYRILNEVVLLDECEVYSWMPEPEYDPHIDAEDGEASEDGFEEDILNDDEGKNAMEVDAEIPASWGQAGMDLDTVPESVAMARTRLRSGNAKRKLGTDKIWSSDEDWEKGNGGRNGGLLWSANYFFYSKYVLMNARMPELLILGRRQKRVLFLTRWCRKRPSRNPSPSDSTSFPLPISSSFIPPAHAAHGTTFIPINRSHRPRINHNRSNARPGQRKSKLTLKSAANGDPSNTIPIRGFETPTARGMAASAPSSYPVHATLSPSAALAKMTAGGFRPRQTPARATMNAAARISG